MALKSAQAAREVLKAVLPDEPEGDEVAYAVEKAQAGADGELRYTFGPVYAPNALDAHGEWADEEELRKALWDFSLNGDRTLRDQHGRGKAGDIVELVQWPFEHEAELRDGDFVRKVKLPAGTVYAGVRWTERGWDEVKKGLKRGFSMGGAAVRVEDATETGLLKFSD